MTKDAFSIIRSTGPVSSPTAPVMEKGAPGPRRSRPPPGERRRPEDGRMTLEDCRRFYAEGIGLAAGVRTPALIEAFARVPRERFLGPGPWQVASADIGIGGVTYLPTVDAHPRHLYHNVPVAIDPGRCLNNGQPGAL